MPLATAAASLVLVTGLAGGAMLYGIFGQRAQVFGRSVWRGSRRRRTIALTFDDGPSEATLELARFLEEEGVRATFFVCGANVRRHPGVIRQLLEAGHEIGNHTQHHRRLCPRIGWKLNLLSAGAVGREISEAQRVIREECGEAPRYFRAPYGMRWFGVGKAQRRLGLTGAMWTAIGHDWEWDGKRVAEHMLGALEPGAIFCLHDGRDTRERPDIASTLEAVRLMVPEVKMRGYGFETMSELMERADGGH